MSRGASASDGDKDARAEAWDGEAWDGPLPALAELVASVVEAVDPRVPPRSLAEDGHVLGPSGRGVPWGSLLESLDLVHRLLDDLPVPERMPSTTGEFAERTWRVLCGSGARSRLRIALVHPGYQWLSPDVFETTGFGGNETSLVLMARALAAAGHQVEVYADCAPSEDQGVRWCPRADFVAGDPRDAVVFWVAPDGSPLRLNAPVRAVRLGGRRSPPGLAEALRCGALNLVIGISRYQRNLLLAEGALPRDACWLISTNGVHIADYARPVPRCPGKCLYSAAPYRGLERLLDYWPEIRSQVPEAELFVTGGYELWGVAPEFAAGRVRGLLDRMRVEPGVHHLGAVPKQVLVGHQLSAQLYLYPTHYEEMECVACVEAGAAGLVPITSDLGALPERVRHGAGGILIAGDPDSPEYRERFIAETVSLLREADRRRALSNGARELAAGYSTHTAVADWLGAFEYVTRRRTFTDISVQEGHRRP